MQDHAVHRRGVMLEAITPVSKYTQGICILHMKEYAIDQSRILVADLS